MGRLGAVRRAWKSRPALSACGLLSVSLILLTACSGDNPNSSAGAPPPAYVSSCMPCHGDGLGGAPVTGKKADWAPRIAKGTGKVQRNAIEGFEGGTGIMPPKGGRLDLSDNEIITLVDYMLEASR
jgi:cytochrome c5